MSSTLVSVGELKSGLSRFLNRAAYGGERVVVSSRGTPKAAVIGMEDLRRLQSIEDLEDALSAYAAMDEHSKGETLPWEEVRERLLAAME
jgi:prevent-host-death family protein